VNREQQQVAAIRAMSASDREYALGRLQGDLYVAANGVSQQARRLREDRQFGPEYMADGRLLAYLLRDAIRLANTAKLLVDDEREAAIEQALGRVDNACPDAVSARDALEHCDDYTLGVGNQQRVRIGDYAQRYSRGGPPYLVRVDPLVIDVDLAEASALHLSNVVLTGSDHLTLLRPPGDA
jgi:hypothetical protein